MIARLMVDLAGDPHRAAGETIEGEDAVRLIAAGYAEPIEERATVTLSPEKATKRKG